MSALRAKRVHDTGSYDVELSIAALDATGAADRVLVQTCLADADEINGWLFALDRELCTWARALRDATPRAATALAWIRERYT